MSIPWNAKISAAPFHEFWQMSRTWNPLRKFETYPSFKESLVSPTPRPSVSRFHSLKTTLRSFLNLSTFACCRTACTRSRSFFTLLYVHLLSLNTMFCRHTRNEFSNSLHHRQRDNHMVRGTQQFLSLSPWTHQSSAFTSQALGEHGPLLGTYRHWPAKDEKEQRTHSCRTLNLFLKLLDLGYTC